VGAYSSEGYDFRLAEFFPMSVFDQITEVRVSRPGVILEEAEARERRPQLTKDGKLTVLAADHPGRMVTSYLDDAVAMGDRQQYLGRVLRVMSSPSVDGIMGTTDVIEDLLIVNRLVKEAGGEGFLDGRVMLGSMNRSGLAGAAWEMDDQMTSFSPDSLCLLGMDGAKIMFRLCLEEPELSNRTLAYCAQAITDCNELGLPVFVEPLPVEHQDGKYKLKRNPNDIIKVMGVAFALGDSSRGTWLKIPYCDDYARVARAATAPALMLGGESTGDPSDILRDFAQGMKAGNNIRGALVGRNVTFPGGDDPLAVALAVNAIVHEGIDAAQAVDILMTNRNKSLDALTKYLG
jgi:hypothetical protein